MLLRWLRVKVLSTADDVADYEAGALLKISCLMAEPGTRLRAGHLYVQRGEPLVRRSVRGSEEFAFQQPLMLQRTPGSGKGDWPMAAVALGGVPVKVPLADIEFLESVLRKGATPV